jgi:glycosyltransferase involved in cell wall biosynthesis
LFATCEGLIAEGHSVDVFSWFPEPPTAPLPPWCRWEPLGPEPWWRTRTRALVRPRSDLVRAGWSPAPGAIAIADEPTSFAAVERFHPAVLSLHNLTGLDHRALRQFPLKLVQDLRAERRITRNADLVLASSERVAQAAGTRAIAVPIAIDAAESPLPLVDEPVAGLIASWHWPPNRMALRWLLDAWPEVRERVPAAQLLLAGRGLADVAGIAGDGITTIGAVASSADFLERIAVFAFPCPPSSGPKVKVLDALGYGMPVVTTEAGAEGLAAAAREGTVVASRRMFARALAEVLVDPARRVEMAKRGRAGVLNAHTPGAAARARVAALLTVAPRSARPGPE